MQVLHMYEKMMNFYYTYLVYKKTLILKMNKID